MSAAHLGLSSKTIERVRSGWVSKLGLPTHVLSNDGVVLVPHADSSTVVALQLQESVVVICPPRLEPLLSQLSKIELLNMTTLMQVLQSHKPDPIGTAAISYAENDILAGRPGTVKVHPADPEDVKAIMSGCTVEEQDESGLGQMPFRFALQSNDGIPAALSGYEVWNNDIAQLGVLTSTQMRRQGLGLAVAEMAISEAFKSNLIPQWRNRLDNRASLQLRRQLGFVQLGLQLAVSVTFT